MSSGELHVVVVHPLEGLKLYREQYNPEKGILFSPTVLKHTVR
jgi:hypothetical protein